MTLKIEVNEDLVADAHWHTVPGLLTTTPIENAEVGSYFRSSIQENEGQPTATLQGHLLKGTPQAMPNLYKAVAYHSEEDPQQIEVVLT